MGEKRQKTVFVLHTSFALVDVLGKLFKEQIPDVRVVNIVDDSLLADVRAAGHVTPSVARRMVGYAQLAQSAGADAIFNACSSVGEVASMIRQTVDIPLIKIDDCMAEEAAARGQNIAVIATVATTLDPTARLVEFKAKEMDKRVTIQKVLVEGAFDILVTGNAQKHDEMVGAAIKKAAQTADVVVLAQASMARIVPQLGNLPAPVLSSPQGGVGELKSTLQRLGLAPQPA